jgi:signal transduction histidine kinase
MVSHELRSPLASLSVAIELLLKSSEGQGALRETLDIARDNVQCLIALIENILNVSQIEAGQMTAQQEPLILLPIIRRAVHMVQVQAGRREIAVKAPENVPYVLADQNKLEIVLNNLLTNAISYSSDGSRILVRVGEPTGDEIVVSVIDEGIGIPKEHLDKLFQRFYRVDASDGRKVYGYGLGLYISKHMLELQGGRIWVESQMGQGSCFSFTLPIVEMSQAMQEEPAAAAIEGQTGLL